MARLPPKDDGTSKQLNLLSALWLCLLPVITHTIIPNVEEMDDADLQLMTDQLNDARSAAIHPANAAPSISSPQSKQEDDITAAIRLPPTHQTPRQQQNNPWPLQQNKSKGCFFSPPE